jgi:hypothetical protein
VVGGGRLEFGGGELGNWCLGVWELVFGCLRTGVWVFGNKEEINAEFGSWGAGSWELGRIVCKRKKSEPFGTLSNHT